jgi:hypothetical protein
MRFGGTLTREKDNVSRTVQPFEVVNVFNGYQLDYSILSLDNSQEIQIAVGLLDQSEVTLDCVQRTGILLGGDCADADFRLLDGVLFEVRVYDVNRFTQSL